MMIVIVTRDDLRDEFAMADEAFALSPISARATLPSEADYDAISEAFLETSRGRWFLGEYAKRNRNADTRMVLDAVARIEETLAAQKQPAPDSGLAEALAAIKSAVNEARAIASEALDGRALEDSLAPVRKGARVIREIAWRLREIGADSRICDLVDSQVGAIEAGCGQLAATDPGAALIAAFELIERRIEGLAGDAPPKASPEVFKDVAAAPPDKADETGQPEAATADAETAHDDAVLDMIAFEMAAPDFSEPEYVEALVAEAAPVEAAIAEAERPPIAVPHRQREPTSHASLGASLIADGIVRRPNVSGSDPLAPIRRMSQTERIALFS